MTRLVTHPLPAGTRPAQREFSRVRATMDDLATTVMTDFTRRRAITAPGEATLKEAENRMISAGVRMLIVVNDKGTIIGLLTYRDIVGQKATAAAVREGTRHKELTVSAVMTPLGEIETLHFVDVDKANIRELVEHMHKSGRQHALVTETDKAGILEPGMVRVRGMFSIVRIGRQLGISLEAGAHARSFSEIERMLAHE